MENSTVYRRPGAVKYALYFILLLLALLILVHFWIGRNWFKTYAQLNALDKLERAQGEAVTTVFRTLNERTAAPGIWLLSEVGNIDKNKAKAVLGEYPETVEMGVLKKGKDYVSIASKTDSEELSLNLIKSAAVYKDSAEAKKSQTSVFDYKTGLGIMIKRYQMNIGERDYGIYFFEKKEDVYITVIDFETMKGLLPEIMGGMKKYHREEFDRYFGPYPEGISVVVTFADKNRQDFYTLGKSKGYEWKEESWDRIYGEKPIIPYGWYIHLQIFTGDRNLLGIAESRPIIKPGLPWTVAADWFRIVELIIGALAILILGHFSPWMHGFRKNRN